MRGILILVIVLVLMSCNTKYNIIDTGLANGKFDGNMYEYFQAHRYDWDSTRLMIEKANLVDLFDGKRAGYEQITFFGPTNHSIRRYMLDNELTRVDEMDEEFCYEIIMKCVVKGKYMRDDIPRGKPAVRDDSGDDDWDDEDWSENNTGEGDHWEDDNTGDDENPGEDDPVEDPYTGQGTGGIVLKGGMDNSFWIYSFQEAYEEVPETGAIVLFIVSLETGGTQIDVASTNIEPTNGVVHSLHYNFSLGEL